MNIPTEIQAIINDYAKPITRPDWRLGSYMIREYKLDWCYGTLARLNYTEFKNYMRLNTNRLKQLEYINDNGDIASLAWLVETRELNFHNDALDALNEMIYGV